jgi:hypothetical protein
MRNSLRDKDGFRLARTFILQGWSVAMCRARCDPRAQSIEELSFCSDTVTIRDRSLAAVGEPDASRPILSAATRDQSNRGAPMLGRRCPLLEPALTQR